MTRPRAKGRKWRAQGAHTRTNSARRRAQPPSGTSAARDQEFNNAKNEQGKQIVCFFQTPPSSKNPRKSTVQRRTQGSQDACADAQCRVFAELRPQIADDWIHRNRPNETNDLLSTDVGRADVDRKRRTRRPNARPERRQRRPERRRANLRFGLTCPEKVAWPVIKDLSRHCATVARSSGFGSNIGTTPRSSCLLSRSSKVLEVLSN